MNSNPIITVELISRNIARAAAFYTGALGLSIIDRSENRLALGSNSEQPPLIVLCESPSAGARARRSAGLYHIALRVPTRAELGRLLARLVHRRVRLHGGADHGVSEALYLADVDGNGLELYVDRPRNEWRYLGDRLSMVTEPLNTEGLLSAAGVEPAIESPIHPLTDIGHLHLQASSLVESERFFSGLLGMQVTQRDFPGALFFSYDGYHHHIGSNTWESQGGVSVGENTVGLKSYTLALSREMFGRIIENLAATGVRSTIRPGAAVLLQDHDGISVHLTVQQQNNKPQSIQRMLHA